MLLFMGEQETEPSRSGYEECLVFAWIGQTFEFCDDCGKPYWEHLYDPTYGDDKGTYRVKVYEKHSKIWYWKKVNPITPERRQAVKDKWDGQHEWALNRRRYGNY